MKKYFVPLFLCGLSLQTIAQFPADKEPFMTKSLSGQSIQKIESKTSGGNITVKGISSGDAKIEVFVTPNNGRHNSLSKEEIQKRLEEDYDLTISVTNNKLTAIAKSKRNISDWKKALNIHFSIYVPSTVSTDLTTSGGNIHLSDLNGTQDFTTSGGNLELKHLTGHIKGRTSGGNVDIDDSKDDIDVSTSGGNVEAENCNGRLKLSTSGGNVQLKSLSGEITATTSGGNVDGEKIGGDLSAHTSGGNVDLQQLTCSLETSTSGGNIDVGVTELGKFIKITNSSGDVHLDIPKNKGIDLKLSGDRIKVATLENFSGKQDEHSMNGSVNGGGVPVTVNAGSGRINLSFR